MDPEQLSKNNLPDLGAEVPNNQSTSPFERLRSRKMLLAAVGAVLLLFLAIGIGMLLSGSGLLRRSGESEPSSSPSPTMTVELKQAVDEARQASQEFRQEQDKTERNYPFLRKLPVATNKYYVYFDLSEEQFVGKIHYVPGDNVEQLEEEALRTLRDDMGIPVGDYDFRWMIDE